MWRGAAAPAQLDEATAERVGKRLQKQVETKLKGLLGAASSKATRARSALSRASAEEGVDLLAARMAAIDAEEREECAEARRAPYKNFSEQPSFSTFHNCSLMKINAKLCSSRTMFLSNVGAVGLWGRSGLLKFFTKCSDFVRDVSFGAPDARALTPVHQPAQNAAPVRESS